MRTTISIDDDVLEAVRYLAEQRNATLGKVLSDLVRQGLRKQSVYAERGGVPVFSVAESAAPITPEHVKSLDDAP